MNLLEYDPNETTGLCMGCEEPVSHRIVSGFENELRLHLCIPCHADLHRFLLRWLHTPDGVSLEERCNERSQAQRCMKCLAAELYRNVSHFGHVVSIYLCNPCQRVLTEQVRQWLPTCKGT